MPNYTRKSRSRKNRTRRNRSNRSNRRNRKGGARFWNTGVAPPHEHVWESKGMWGNQTCRICGIPKP